MVLFINNQLEQGISINIGRRTAASERRKPMKRHLISEWSVGEHSGQLAIVGHSEGDLQIALEVANQSGQGTILFLWDESDVLVQGVTEVLITKHGELKDELIIGIAISRMGSIVFGWSPFEDNDCALMFSQGEEKILIAETHAVEFFRWLRRSLQLIGRIV